MASPAIASQGTTFQVETATPATDVEILGVVSWDGLDGEAPDVDVSDLKSTAREFRNGLKDNGSFTIEGFRDDDDPGQARLETIRGASTSTPFIVTLSNGDTYEFNGLVKSFTSAGEVDGSNRFRCAIRIDGNVTIVTA